MPDTSVQLEQVFPLIQERLAAGESVQFTPQGTSMRPTIYGGRDQVVLSPLPEKPSPVSEIISSNMSAVSDRIRCWHWPPDFTGKASITAHLHLVIGPMFACGAGAVLFDGCGIESATISAQ